MKELIEKFIKKLEKSEDYYVLKQDDEAIIVGTKIIIKEHKEFLGNVFQPRTQNIDKELPVFFLITFNKEKINITKEFSKKSYPILNFTKSFNIKNLKQSLDEFVNSNFK